MILRDIKELYSEKITIINKLKAEDTSKGKEDIWQKTEYNAAYWLVSHSGQFNEKEISTSKAISIYLTDLKNYLPYKDWAKYGAESEYFTLSLNDYIVKGSVVEDINKCGVTKVVQRYAPFSCRVTGIEIPKQRGINVVKMVIRGI